MEQKDLDRMAELSHTYDTLTLDEARELDRLLSKMEDHVYATARGFGFNVDQDSISELHAAMAVLHFKIKDLEAQA